MGNEEQKYKYHRKSIRLKGYDYSLNGCYFITICCHNSMNRFGEITDGKMRTNELGQIAEQELNELGRRYKTLYVAEKVIMPNHIHFILTIEEKPTDNYGVKLELGNIIGAYKSIVNNKCLELYRSANKSMGKLWQRNFYERVIRDNREYDEIVDYMHNNPVKWWVEKQQPEL